VIRRMATESTEEHGIKNIHVGCAVRTEDDGNHHRDAKDAEKSIDSKNLTISPEAV
jgi:hypothetical protein